MTNIDYLRNIKKTNPDKLDIIIERKLIRLCQDCQNNPENKFTISDACETCLTKWLNEKYVR